MLTRRQALLGSVPVLAGCARRKGSGFPGYAFIANADGSAIAVVDLTAFALARHIPLDASPTAVLAHPTRRVIYALTPSSGEVHEIDAARLAPQRRTASGRTAHSMRMAPDGTALWVASPNPAHLARINLDALRAEFLIPLAAPPVDFDISPDGIRAAVTFGEAGAFALIDVKTRSVQTYASTRVLSRVRFRSDTKAVLAGDTANRALAIFDAHDGRTIVNLPLPVRPDHFCVKQDGGQLFITGEGMDAVVFVYPYSTEIGETVLTGKAPGVMAECPSAESNYLFIANSRSGEATIIDIETRKVLAVAAVGREPVAIGITPDNQYALVLNRASGDVAVIRIAAIALKRLKSAPLFTMIPVGSGPVSVAIPGV